MSKRDLVSGARTGRWTLRRDADGWQFWNCQRLLMDRTRQDRYGSIDFKLADADAHDQLQTFA
jgi:hypothetical protein